MSRGSRLSHGLAGANIVSCLTNQPWSSSPSHTPSRRTASSRLLQRVKTSPKIRTARSFKPGLHLVRSPADLEKLAINLAFVNRKQVDVDELPDQEDILELAESERVEVAFLLNGRKLDSEEVSSARAALEKGATLQLQRAAPHDYELAALAGQLSADLGGEPTRCNVYLSPSPKHVGFGTHHDTLDAFILQRSGEKRWRIWKPKLVDPIWVMSNHLQATDEGPYLDVTLGPGDVLFLPRGHPHAASCQGSAPSLHFTISVKRITAQDVLEYLLLMSKDILRFRESAPWLPAGGESGHEWAQQVALDAASALNSPANGTHLLRKLLAHRAATGTNIETTYANGPSADLAGHVRLRTPLIRGFIDDSNLFAGRHIFTLPRQVVEPIALLFASPCEQFCITELASRFLCEEVLLAEVLQSLSEHRLVHVGA